MPQYIQSYAKYIATHRKEDTLLIRFHRGLNNFFLDEVSKDKDPALHNLWDDSLLNHTAREEFIAFMQEHCPGTDFVPVADDAFVAHYFGTFAIDTPLPSECYDKLVQKYEDDRGKALSNDVVLWIVSYEDAKKTYQKEIEAIESGL